MFDASWIDHERETVAQRRSRKGNANGSRKTSTANGQNHSRRSSMLSSTSTEGPAKPTLLNFFGGASSSSTQKALQRSKSQSKLNSSSEKKATEASRWVQNHCNATLESVTQCLSETVLEDPQRPSTVNTLPSASYVSDAEQSSASDVSESAFSGWTGITMKTQSSWSEAADSVKNPGRIVQPLSPTSFISQNTEITVSPRDSVKEEEQIATIVHITAAGAPVPDCLDPLPETPSPTYPNPFLVTSFGPGEDKSTILMKKEVARSGWPFTTRSGVKSPDVWKPPEAWDCVTEEDIKQRKNLTLKTVDFSRAKQLQESTTTVELTQLQRNIKRMEAASPKIVLERLKEEWNEIADASVYKELELEKQLWMLTALRSLKKRASDEQMVTTTSLTGTTKVLSLYENQASASCLSALTSTPTEIHHLSTSPLSPAIYPNIYPLSVPGPTSQLPYASQNFTAIHAFALPSLLPASSIPSILKECHRTLTSSPHATSPTSPSSSTSTGRPVGGGGTLHLTILDPAPLPSTLGPRLRDWLDNHLLLHLEKQFRCLNPSRLFPIWLADAGLRAEGSTIVHVRFLGAVGPGEEGEAGEGLDRTKLELKSVVGRMLWKEMWGGYVKADKWWWEDEEVLGECERMGTAWEYAVIEGVKEG